MPLPERAQGSGCWWRRLGRLVVSRAGPLVLVALVIVVTALRIRLVLAGPDLDSDAYGHAIAGRRMLENWRDVTIHWVWLPGLHSVYAIAMLLGGSIQVVRWMNVVLSAIAPILFVWMWRDGAAGGTATPASWVRGTLPWLAGCLLVLDPLGLWLGETGQTEPLFQVLVLASCLAWEKRRHWLCAVFVTLATMVRYEAWLLPGVLFVLAIAERPRTAKRFLAVVFPGLATLAWCWVHYRATGEPLQFLRLNSEFTRGYFRDIGFPWGNSPELVRMGLWYWMVVPFFCSYRWVYAFAMPGWLWAVRHTPSALRWTSLALLGFLTVEWMRCQHLGLPRHAVVLAPIYAVAVASGFLLTLQVVAPWLQKSFRLTRRTVTGAAIAALLGWMAQRQAIPQYRFLAKEHRRAFLEEREAASTVRQQPAVGLVFCDRTIVEVLSGLRPGMFMRWNVLDLTPESLEGSALERGTILIVSTPDRASHLVPLTEKLYGGRSVVVLRYTRRLGATGGGS